MDKDKDVEELLSRGVSSFIDPGGTFKEKLLKKIRGEYQNDIVIKLGVDPSRPDIHLGHAVILHKLRQFQNLGCKVIFLVGDFTARIGDPSGKSKVRPEIEQAEVDLNAKTYIEQVGKILLTGPQNFSWIRNSDWFTNITDLDLPDSYKVDMNVTIDEKITKVKIAPNSFVGKAIVFEETRMQIRDLGLKEHISIITLSNILWSLKHITHSRLIERDMFQERIKSGDELYMHEMLYPILQGIDSYVLSQVYGSCDLEIGGNDQTFNMLIGRDIMKANNAEQQSVLSLEILPGLDGKEKMSKSLDNYIAIVDTPTEMFGKVMSIPDTVLNIYFQLATYASLLDVVDIEKKLKYNPRDIKARLAHEIVAIYHGEDLAKEAGEDFTKTFSKGGVPKDIEKVSGVVGAKLSEYVIAQHVVESKTEWRRLVKEGAISNIETGEKISSADETISKSITLKIGKHRFLCIEVK